MVYTYDNELGVLICSREIDGELKEIQRFRLPVEDFNSVEYQMEAARLIEFDLQIREVNLQNKS